MEYIRKPEKSTWDKLIQRPVFEQEQLEDSVQKILDRVKQAGDTALREYSLEFDGVKLRSLEVSEQELNKANMLCAQELKEAIKLAKSNIEKFHTVQQLKEKQVTTMQGVSCWRKSVGIEKVGLYIPGGSAPLFSTILMLGIPANIAGCKEVVLCTPPDENGEIHPAILFTAQLVGVDKIYKVGGAQAIAAMAYGTETITSVFKIFGPGNQYVTKAKECIQRDGIAIDIPAGPSEVLVIADKTGNPEFIAAGLLSQAEHGPDSQVILLSADEGILIQTLEAVEHQLSVLPRKDIARLALENSRAILLDSVEQCLEFSNAYAPEHLILALDNPEYYTDLITNAGSVFLGHYSCESAGDYASGTNHTLPTNGYAKNYSGVSLDSFVKKITFQNISKQGLKAIGPAIEIMAEAEELMAHKYAVTIRLNEIQND